MCLRRSVTVSCLLIATVSTVAAQERPTTDSTTAGLRLPFRWQASGPLLSAPADDADEYFSLKDPSIVFYQNAWHLFGTVRGRMRSHQIEYVRFASFDELGQGTQGSARGGATADAAALAAAGEGDAAETDAPGGIQRAFLKIHDGFYCAPQVFYFRPQQKWYLICQASDPQWPRTYGPAFSTSPDITDVERWERLKPLEHRRSPSHTELDFWIICDDQNAHLFFTSLDGRMWREQTRLEDFPGGWSDPVVALEADVFEASHTYLIQSSGAYLTLIEAQHPHGGRWYKAFLADRLDGPWRPAMEDSRQHFASAANIRFDGLRWADWISHGELLRAGYDERLAIDANPLRFMFQGVKSVAAEGRPYGEIPWQLGLLTQLPDEPGDR